LICMSLSCLYVGFSCLALSTGWVDAHGVIRAGHSLHVTGVVLPVLFYTLRAFFFRLLFEPGPLDNALLSAFGSRYDSIRSTP
jgi:hypothetical protein